MLLVVAVSVCCGCGTAAYREKMNATLAKERAKAKTEADDFGKDPEGAGDDEGAAGDTSTTPAPASGVEKPGWPSEKKYRSQLVSDHVLVEGYAIRYPRGFRLTLNKLIPDKWTFAKEGGGGASNLVKMVVSLHPNEGGAKPTKETLFADHLDQVGEHDIGDVHWIRRRFVERKIGTPKMTRTTFYAITDERVFQIDITHGIGRDEPEYQMLEASALSLSKRP